MKRLSLKFRVHSDFFAWHLLPTIRVGCWDHRDRPSMDFGGFIAVTWLKSDACLSFTVKPRE